MDNNDEVTTSDMPPEGVAFGWVNDPVAVEEVVSKLPYRTFADTPAYQMAADELPDHCYLWDYAKQATGNLLPPANQGQIGSCVSFGTARAIEYTICAEIVNGQKEEFAKLVEEIIYGGSRVEIGGGRLGYGDGSIGAWAASFVKKYGILDRKVHGKYDFTKYSESRCREYGRYGVPNDIEPEVKKHPVKETVLVTNTEQAMKALYQGWGIAVCSGQGFSMRRDSNGICRASGDWAHCVLPDSLIAGPSFKTAREISIGDMVYGHDGETHEVKEVYTRDFKGTLVRIKAKGMPAVSTTDEHPFLIYRRARKLAGQTTAKLAEGTSVADVKLNSTHVQWMKYEAAWVSAKDIRPGDYILTPNLQKTIIEAPIKLNPDIAWMLGFFVGDGHTCKNHKIGFTLSLTDSVETIQKAFAELNLETHVQNNPTFRRVFVYSAKLANSFREWFGADCYSKSIPSWIMHSEYAEDFLQGYLQADGCVYKNRHIVTTASLVLAHQLKLLIGTLGHKPAMYEKKPTNGFKSNCMHYTIEWRPESKGNSVRNQNGFVMHKVDSIVLLPYEGKVYNYEVDECHSYICDGIAVHNCMTIAGWTTIDGKIYFRIDNSWGANAHTGPTGPGSPGPEGFYAAASVVNNMLAEKDSFAFSAVEGFPLRKIRW